VAVLDHAQEQAVQAPHAAPVAVPSAAPAPQIAQMLSLQQSAGNCAVSRMISARGTLARDPADTADAPAAADGQGGAPSPVADLAARAGSAAGLRAMITAAPALADQVIAYLATAEDPALNALMAAAFPPVPAESAGAADAAGGAPADGAAPADGGAPAGGGDGGGAVAKNPTDPTVPLPAPITNSKTLDKGEMKWTLKAASHTAARVDLDFKPDSSKVEAKNVSFGQTVLQQIGTKRVYPGDTGSTIGSNAPTFTPFEDPSTHKRMDLFPVTENDPFYGAEWDQGAKRWKGESAVRVPGSSTKGVGSTSAKMDDTPDLPMAREGKGDATSEFESVAMVLETREPLGALKWGFQVKDAANAPIELTGGQPADCTDAPSADWGAAMDQFYAGFFEDILDNFDIAKSDLKPDHKTKLDSVATKMKGNVALKCQLGGAADLTGDAAFNQALSLKRAQAARDYLVSKGIDAGRIELQSYGADWARAREDPGVSEGKNRRVQIWLH
jgi:outer membrane protein OmpA-like peptidoglycan-associated protein